MEVSLKELRIGNLFKQFGHIQEVSWSTLKDLDNAPQSQLWCKPIPLTEEWLTSFGFEKRPDGDYNLLKYSEVDIVINQFFDGWKCDGVWFSVNHLEYVHQLQNLYFALTGEELTIKE